MEPKQQRSLELRTVSLLAAVIVVLMGFSAALATKDEAAAAPLPQQAAPAYQDPSLAGLSVADDAEPDGTVELFN
jgi:hypothetical protein